MHPDILTEYGIITEIGKENIVEAEELYTRALHCKPDHREALMYAFVRSFTGLHYYIYFISFIFYIKFIFIL